MVVDPSNARRLTCRSGLGTWWRAVFPVRSCLCPTVSDDRDRWHVRRSGRCQRLASTDLDWLFVRCLPADGGPFSCRGNPDDSAVGAMIVVFAVAMAFAGRHLNRILAETMRLRFELSEANQRLSAEIAEREATQAALYQAQKLEALGQLTGGIAHDFNNILAIIINNLGLVGKRLGENSSATPLDRRRGSGSRSRRRTHPTIAWVRPQTAPRLRSLSISLVLSSAFKEMLRQTLGPQIELLDLTLPRHLAPAEVDSDQLELAILNFATQRARCDADRRLPADRAWPNAASRTDSRPRNWPPAAYLVICGHRHRDSEWTTQRSRDAVEPFFTTKKSGRRHRTWVCPTVLRFVAQSGGSSAADECARRRHHGGAVATTRSNPAVDPVSIEEATTSYRSARLRAELQRRQT